MIQSRKIYVHAVAFLVVFCAVSCKNVNVVRSKRNPPGLNDVSCDNVRPFFQMRNITETRQPGSQKGNFCNGECCDDNTESLLRIQGQRDFATLLRHNSRTLQGLLSSTADTLQNHVLELASQSENKTLVLFSQVYQGMSVLSRGPITTLYKDIRNYIVANTTHGELSSATMDMKASVHAFFTDLFPLAYHGSGNTPKRDFTVDYKACLKKSMENILPFGDIPNTIAGQLSKSLEATRFLLQAFNIGSSVLNSTDSLLTEDNGSAECYDALIKMTYCGRCQGLNKHTKPCSGYCLNVLRGCITKYVAELDLPWNGYVDSIESLVNAMKKNNNDAGVNVDLVIRNLDTQISSAIMHSMERTKEIDSKVKSHCGPAEFSKKEDPLMAEVSTPTPTPSSGKPSRLPTTRMFSPLPEHHLSHFLTSISKTRSFYGNLADSLCQDESFAEPKDKSCWNGERIADYTKVVVDVGLDMQKYNPEVKPTAHVNNVDPKVAELVDKLRRVHHVAITSLGPYVEDYMQQDGIEGSGQGSGQEPDFSDDEDEYNNNGSGSGDNAPTEPDMKMTDSPRHNLDTPRVTMASANVSRSSTIMLLILAFAMFARIN